jgi:hypothetical protein
MKKILIVLFGLFMSMTAKALDAEVTAFKAAFDSGEAQAINTALIQLNGAILKHELVDQSKLNAPSPERLQRRHEIIAALDPVKKDLIKLFQGPDQNVASNAVVVLSRSGGGPEVYEALRKVVATSRDDYLPEKALSSLYALRLADEEVRNISAQRIANYKERGERQVAFGLLRVANYELLPEALPTCVEMLKSDAAVGSKMVAANAIMRLGPAAAAALPELQRFLAQLRAQGGDFRDINMLERAVQVVSGQSELPKRVSAAATATPALAAPVLTVMPETSSVPVTHAGQTPAPTAERKSQAWPWVVGILALIVIVTVALKRRGNT